MNKKVYISLITALVINANAADLGTISVESSTIGDVGTINKKTESSTINHIDSELIETINPKNINEVLQTIPGITADVRSTIVEIHIRGIAQQEFMWEDTGVAILIDGVPLLQNGGKVRLNLDNIESIKVIKGGASYLYGNNAMAGALLITTKKQKNKNGGSISVEYGSENFKNIKGSIYKGTEDYSLNLNSNYRSTDGYWEKTYVQLKSINGKGQYYIDETSDLTLGADITRKYDETTGGSVTGMSEALSNPTGEGDGSVARTAEFYTDLDKYFLTYNKDFSDTANLKVNTYYYKDLYDYVGGPADLNGDNLNDTHTTKTEELINQYGIKTEFKDSIDQLAYLIGVDLGQKELETDTLTTVTYMYRGPASYHHNGELDNSVTDEDNQAIYTELQYNITPKLTTTFNARLDQDKYTYTVNQLDAGTAIVPVWNNVYISRNKNFTNDSYRVGFAYQLDDDQTIYSNISTGFRNPLVSDIYKGDFDSDYTNNTDLKPETTLSYELGIRGDYPFLDNSLGYEVTVFHTDTKDIIGRNGGTYYSNNADLMMDNVGDAVNRGLELMLKTDTSKTLSANLSYTYLDSYYTSHQPFWIDLGTQRSAVGDQSFDIKGNELPRVPHHKLDIMVNYKITPKLDLMTEFYAQSSYYADETNFVKMPGYEKINMKLTYEHNSHWTYFTKIDNIFDKQHVRTAFATSDRNTNGVLDIEDVTITVDPGRVFYMGLQYKF